MRILRASVVGGIVLALFLPLMARAAATTIELTYWDQIRPGDGSPRGTALAANLARFEALHPGITVKPVTMSSPLILANLIQTGSAGTGPDVSQVLDRTAAGVVAAGAFQPLDGFATSDDKTGWLIPWNEPGSTIVNGKKYGLPYGYRFDPLIYRKDVLTKAGVDVPTTWDEVCTAAGKINSPQVMGFAFVAAPQDNAAVLMELAEPVLLAGGADYFNAQGQLAFNNAAGLRFFQLISDLVHKCNASGPQVVQMQSANLDEGLKAGTIGMTIQGSHRFKTIQAMGAGANLGWAFPPSLEKGKPAPVSVQAWLVGMGKFTKHPKESWELIRFLTSPEAQVRLAQVSEIPSRTTTLNDPWFKTPDAQNMVAWSHYMGQHGKLGTYPANWSAFTQIFDAEVQAIVLKNEAPATALQNVVQKYSQLNK